MYEVINMTLIPQNDNTSCWYASAQMLIRWKMDEQRQSFLDLVPPELDAECRRIRDGGRGIFNPQILPMAKRLGLKAVPPLSPTPQAIENWLRSYGPLWVNGQSHIVVIAGIRGEMVKVYDPWPPRVGQIDWRSLADWYVGGQQPLGPYRVRPGDSLSAIAGRYGLRWRDLYDHADNAAFRRKRPDPNRIYPGDVLMVPQPNSTRDTSNAVTAVFLHCPMLP